MPTPAAPCPQPVIAEVIRECFHAEPGRRPTFLAILDRLEALQPVGLVPSPSCMEKLAKNSGAG